MVFSSPIFLFIFLPFVLLGYYLVPKKFRNLLLMLASLGFFAFTGKKALLFFLLFILINFAFGWLLDLSKKTTVRWMQRTILFISITVDVGLLLYFKYTNLFTSTMNQIAGTNFSLRESFGILGISFFTFSALSYLLDINSGKITAHKNFLEFALYISFFPKLLQGPIARFGEIIPFVKERVTGLDQVSEGVLRFTQGLAKKVIIADQVGVFVDQVFSTPAYQNSTAVSWLGAIGYALQIYFDFSGYTDMAIGIGRMFGYKLPENFNYPYLSTSISEFWRRWHITLSSWFRDYLFIPLEFQRRRVKFLRSETNILIVFLLTGLWHGASWNFIVWGLLHGFFISLEVFIRSLKIKWRLPYPIRLIGTLLVILTGWVIFRAGDLTYAAQYLRVMFGFVRPETTPGGTGSVLTANFLFFFLLGVLLCLPWKSWLKYLNLSCDPRAVIMARMIGFAFLLLYSIILVLSSSYQPFIYFQF